MCYTIGLDIWNGSNICTEQKMNGSLVFAYSYQSSRSAHPTKSRSSGVSRHLFYAGQIRNQSWLLASTQWTCRRLRIPRLTWKSECTKLRSLRWRSAWQAQSCILGMNCCDYAFCVRGRTNSLQLSLVMLDILYLRCSYASTLERWDRRKEKERYPETKRALEWHYFK